MVPQKRDLIQPKRTVVTCGALNLLQKPRTTGGDSAETAAGLKRFFWDLVGARRAVNASHPSGTAEQNLEWQSEKKLRVGEYFFCAVLAVHPRTLEPETRPHIWRGGSLTPDCSWQQS
jgi:hypothetical protein